MDKKYIQEIVMNDSPAELNTPTPEIINSQPEESKDSKNSFVGILETGAPHDAIQKLANSSPDIEPPDEIDEFDNYLESGVTPEKVFRLMLKHTPNPDFKKGVYTELHIDPSTGKLYVAPQIAPADVHYASIGGYHSMFDALTKGKKENIVFKYLPFSTETLVAEAETLKDDDGNIVLQLNGAHRKEVIEKLLKDNNHNVPPLLRIQALLTAEKEAMGISKVMEIPYWDRNKKSSVEVEIKDEKIPEFDDYTVDYIQKENAEASTTLRNGVVALEYYDKPRNRTNQQNSPDKQVVKTWREGVMAYTIYETNSRTHEETILKMFPQIEEDTKMELLFGKSDIDIGGSLFKVGGRHTIDESGNLQINLILSGKDFIGNRQSVQDFEFGFVSTYLQKLRTGNKIQEVKIIVSEIESGKPKFQRLEIPSDVDESELPGYLYEQIGEFS